MKRKIGFSLSFGLIYGILTHFFMNGGDPSLARLSWVSGFLFALCMFVSLVIQEKRQNKKYAEAEKSILSPVWLKINGNIKTGRGTRNGNIYFCENGVVFISLDKKPYMTDTVLLPDIEAFLFNNAKLLIRTKDNGIYIIDSGDTDETREKLKIKGWIE